MNVVQEIRRLNAIEQRQGGTASWHDDYKDSAYIFVGGLPFDLTEGDVICVFSQYGEVVNINLVRDKETGKSKGFAFLQYEDQRSTVLAVDNFNGTKVLGRTLRVDHVKNYRQPKQGDSDELPAERAMNAAPEPLPASDPAADDEALMREAGIDPDDPMAEYYLKKHKRRLKKQGKERAGHRSSRHRSRHSPSRSTNHAMAALPSKIRSDCVINPPAAVPFKVVTAEPPSSADVTPAETEDGSHTGHPMFIGVGGGRGAGKEYTCRYVIDKVRERGYTELAERVVHLHLDDFHRELSAEDRAQLDAGTATINFDHPEAYDFAMLARVMQQLRRGEAVDVPQWNGRQQRRTGMRRVT
ncbi:RNA-binding protein Cwf29, partial [Coemansia sp. RSA 2708]